MHVKLTYMAYQTTMQLIKWVLIAEIAVTKKYNSQQFNQTMMRAFAVKSPIQLPLGENSLSSSRQLTTTKYGTALKCDLIQ